MRGVVCGPQRAGACGIVVMEGTAGADEEQEQEQEQTGPRRFRMEADA